MPTREQVRELLGDGMDYAAAGRELDIPVGQAYMITTGVRGATLIHVDPRFTRTSALAGVHVPLRAGTDIAFLGGIVNYVLANDKFFPEYVVNYTNAATIITEKFAGTEDLDGLFSGFDPEHRTYDSKTWQYEDAEVQAASGERGNSTRTGRSWLPCASRAAARRTAPAART